MSAVITNEDRRRFAEFISNSMLLAQSGLRSRVSGNGPCRDYDKEFGYAECPDHHEFKKTWERSGIAQRIVALLSDESWAIDPLIYDEEDESVESEFEKAVKELAQKLKLWSTLQRLDEISGIGQFGVMLVGVSDGQDLSSPILGLNDDGTQGIMKKALEVLFLRPLDQTYVEIKDWEEDTSKKRYGDVKTYSLSLGNPKDQGSGVNITNPNVKAQVVPTPASALSKSTSLTQAVEVHWHRVIHVADNKKASHVAGIPRQQTTYNHQSDIKKVLGGSGEMFYKGGLMGLSIESAPGLEGAMASFDIEKLRQMMTDYEDGLSRWIALNGMKANPLQPQVADPSKHFLANIQAICIAIDCPQRIFMGSEEGRLAADQDSKRWRRKIARRRDKHCTDYIIRPVIDLFIAIGALPKPKDDKYEVFWEQDSDMSPEERAKIVEYYTNAIAKYVQAGCDVFIPPMEFLTKFMHFDTKEAQEICDAALKQIEDSLDDEGTPEGGEPQNAFQAKAQVEQATATKDSDRSFEQTRTLQKEKPQPAGRPAPKK